MELNGHINRKPVDTSMENQWEISELINGKLIEHQQKLDEKSLEHQWEINGKETDI